MYQKIISLLAIFFLFWPMAGRALEIPMGVSPKELSVEKFVPFDEPLNVDYLPEGNPGYLALVRGDGAMKNGDHTGIPLSGIRFNLHFWNVGEAGGESGFWLWKKKHADATLTVSYEVSGPGNKWFEQDKDFMGLNSFKMEVPSQNPEFNPVVYDLTFSGGPNGEFNEKKPYKHKKGLALWGSVDDGATLSLNIPPNVETGDNPFWLEVTHFGSVELDKSFFGDWPLTLEDCVDSHATINSMSGTVEVKKVDKGEWVFAKYDMTLCVGDIIKTGEESRVHVLWPSKDYFLESETQLLIKSLPRAKDKSAVEIISGKVKANFQKALEGKDIYTEEGFPNYVMGIKGTTIEVEAGAEQSIFRLLEGSVELTYTKDPSKKIMVASGDEILAKADGVMEKKSFDAPKALAAYEAEKKTWVRGAVDEVSTESSAKSESMPVAQSSSMRERSYLIWTAVGVALLLLGLLWFVIYKRKSQR